MRSVDVLVVGGGPAALGASAALRDASASVLVVTQSPYTPHPVFLSERALTSLDSMNLGRPSGHTITTVTIASAEPCQGMTFPAHALTISGQGWQQFLHQRMQTCVNSIVPGQVHLENARNGIVSVLTIARERFRVQARWIIWATGSRPSGHFAGPEGTADAYASVSRVDLSEPTANSGLQFTLSTPRNGPAHTVYSAWHFHLDRTTLIYGNMRADGRPPAAARPPGSQIAQAPLPRHYAADTTVDASLLLAGAAAGLGHPLTGEGISYALRSGYIAGQCAQLTAGVTTAHRDRHAAAFGEPRLDPREDARRLVLTTRAVRGALYAPNPARRWLVGAVTDHSFADEHVPNDPDVSPSWTPNRARARKRIRAIVARQAASLWGWPISSLTHLPRLPRLRLSDLLVACCPEDSATDEPVLRGGAAIDLMLGSMGLLAASLSDSNPTSSGDDHNAAETVAVVALDVAAGHVLHLASQAGPSPFDAFLMWLNTLRTLRQSFLDGAGMPPVTIFETVFEFPCRLAGICTNNAHDDDTPARMGQLCGRAFALGDEYRYQSGQTSRIGLSATQADSAGLRPSISELSGTPYGLQEPQDSLEEVVSTGTSMVEAFGALLVPLRYTTDPDGILPPLFHALLGAELTARLPDETVRALL